MSFENENGRTSHSEYYLPKVEIKDYNVKIDGKALLINQQKRTLEHMKALEKLLLVNEMIIQLVFYYIILTLKKIIKWLQ